MVERNVCRDSRKRRVLQWIDTIVDSEEHNTLSRQDCKLSAEMKGPCGTNGHCRPRVLRFRGLLLLQARKEAN